MNTRIMLLVGTLLAVAVNPLGAKDLTVISWGRVNQKEHAKAYLGPFEKSTGVKVSSYSWGGELNELIREMMGAGKTSWDVVEVGTAELLNGCKEGLYEKLDRTRLGNAKELIPGAVSRMWTEAHAWLCRMASHFSCANAETEMAAGCGHCGVWCRQ